MLVERLEPDANVTSLRINVRWRTFTLAYEGIRVV